MGTRVPTINVLSKSKKFIEKKNDIKINIFIAVEFCCILIAWACFRNVKNNIVGETTE